MIAESVRSSYSHGRLHLDKSCSLLTTSHDRRVRVVTNNR